MKRAVVADDIRPANGEYPAQRLFDPHRWNIGVDPGQCITQAVQKEYLPVIPALLPRHAGSQVRAVQHRPAQFGQPFQAGLFEDVFGDAGHEPPLRLAVRTL